MLILKSNRFLYVAVLAMTLAGCGEKVEDESKTEEEDPTGTVSGTGGGKTDTYSIAGTWLSSNCEAAALALQGEGEGEGEGGGGEDGYKKESFTFGTDATAKISFAMFADAPCADKMLEMKVEGTYTVGTEISADPVIRQLDVVVSKGTMTIHSQEFVDQLNGGGAGLNLLGDGFPCTNAVPWVKDAEVSFADLECANDIPKIGATLYELVSVTADVLRMSNKDEAGKDGTSAETRPTTLSTSDEEAYKKVVE